MSVTSINTDFIAKNSLNPGLKQQLVVCLTSIIRGQAQKLAEEIMKDYEIRVEYKPTKSKEYAVTSIITRYEKENQ